MDATMVDVAEKWFGLKKSNKHKILVEDGVEFFKNRDENGSFFKNSNGKCLAQYDSIFIDACQTDHDDELHCPISEFRIDEMAYHVHRSIAENGGLSFLK